MEEENMNKGRLQGENDREVLRLGRNIRVRVVLMLYVKDIDRYSQVLGRLGVYCESK